MRKCQMGAVGRKERGRRGDKEDERVEWGVSFVEASCYANFERDEMTVMFSLTMVGVLHDVASSL